MVIESLLARFQQFATYPAVREYLSYLPRSTLSFFFIEARALHLIIRVQQMKKAWAYVFITTRQPRKVVQSIRKIRGVTKADALFGTPDAIAIVEGTDIATMDAVIDKIALVPNVLSTDQKLPDG